MVQSIVSLLRVHFNGCFSGVNCFMGVCVHEGQLHALTEYMEGGSLEQLILSRPPEPLPQPLRVSLAADVAEGMMYLHSLGVFHRDLTTKNVLLRKIGEGDYMAVVADFGLAAKIPHPVNGYRLPSVGSPWWMSPECLRGRWYDHRSDIFSYGIILCQLIARVDADPDVLPRTDNFGLNYMAFVELCDEDTVPDFLRLTFNCCIYEPKARPLFPEIVSKLAEVKESLDDTNWGSHSTNNHHESEDADSSGPRSCPGLYAWRRPQRYRSEGSPRHHDHDQREYTSTLTVSLFDLQSMHPLTIPVCSATQAFAVGAGVGRRGLAGPRRARGRGAPLGLGAGPRRGAGARAAPPRLARLHRLAHIMLLRDAHAAPTAARRPLDTFRGVKKILEPHPGSASCASLASPPRAASRALEAADDTRAASLPSSPALSRRGSLDARAPRSPAHELRRRASCESGIFSVANEELCPARAGAKPRAAVCPCSLVGCHRCWWWRRDPDVSEAAPGPAPTGEARARLCADCLLQYDRALDARPSRRAPLDDSALAVPSGSLRSLDEDTSSFLCGRRDVEAEAEAEVEAEAGAAELCEYHILATCCCAAGAGWARRARAGLGKRSSSVYTDSSEDVASLAGSDSVYMEERLPRAARSQQIRQMVEYFERAGAGQACERARGRRVRLTLCAGAVRSKLPLFDTRC
ncbi:hypothetical protein HF086_005165 [Spodoptera exigua]|uniref:dual-specificity kinase n=1 Tax=Spodoptera exigua TaxID=7107 RepID=A0A922MTZ1_SPOEX|nr:hypothetical protein HF086_005165 [Spodoptera exigua]